MKVVVRRIYYKAVTPSCDLIEMDDATWKEFLFADGRKRIEIALKLLGKENQVHHVRELAWIPLDDNIEVTIKKRRRSRAANPTYRCTFTQEQIDAFRKEYQEECVKINNDPDYSTTPLTDQELQASFNRLSDDEIRYLLEIGSPPSSRAYIEMYYGN